MPFSADQKAQLGAPLNRSNVKEREQGGRKLSYVEGWFAIEEANRIFGFDAWSRETLQLACVADVPREIGKDKAPGFGVTYVCRVRIDVGGIMREGCGAGHGIDRDRGLAHESALKEAETDAMKRALMTFGNPFGLALYDKTQANVADESEIVTAELAAKRAAFVESCKADIKTYTDRAKLSAWWKSDEQKKQRRKYGLTDDEVKMLVDLVMAHAATLPEPSQPTESGDVQT